MQWLFKICLKPHNYSAGNTIQAASFVNGVFILAVNQPFPTDQYQAPKIRGVLKTSVSFKNLGYM